MSAKPQVKGEPPAPDTVSIEVNGRALQARKGEMIIQVTDAAGIYVPRFCYHHKLSVAANCRMCLVEVEKAPKPMPACATPVAEGMKVYTRSALARDAQKGVMEFLLINHPLDCPICDQGGECPLQDLALGYGKDVSRYALGKRVVEDKDIGPLIATELTRCIHCTRCVRFGQELAGVMELGMIGRGEHSEIRTFLTRSVDSELSGNVIDLCPVGALTSKPFRFKARAWELESHPSVSPHDCVGSNLNVQSLRHEVKRVLPRVNEAINECWLSDRDRFSYEGLNSAERLCSPMIRQDGRWEEVDWTTALEHAVAGLTRTVERHGADALGALAAPGSTLEEFYLLQKLTRGLGCANVDHRLRQLDFSDDAVQPLFPGLGQPIEALETLEAALLIGSNIRKEQPLLGQRLRKAARRGAQIMVLNPVDYDFAFPLAQRVITDPRRLPTALAAVAKALVELRGASLREAPGWFAGIAPEPWAREMARSLAQSKRVAVLVGGLAAAHPQSAMLRVFADCVAELIDAPLALLAEGNSAGAWLAGCVPHRGPLGAEVNAGRHARAMLTEPRKAYLLLGLEPELDCLDGAAARAM
ncbi:MAG TPA: NADH-quinone oxidoreductase subunit NuoG, partial [Steroidobacteraceae bacterium]|nr:NADH-quinone oxidoreductase subunit NuoG [Steroidobacteraceae bacterium]